MKETEQTLYEILGVLQNATLKEIKIAYRKTAMKYHTDNFNVNNESSHNMMCKINEAYRILSNSDSRAIYDETLYEKGKFTIPDEEDTSSSKKE